MTILEGSIDEKQMTVEACVLSPCISYNKRYYPPQVVESAASQLIGLKSFADHENRSVKNIIAKITSAKVVEGKAVATFKFSKARDVAESVFTRIKEGIITDVSIAASGSLKQVKVNNEWIDEVTEIKVHSVDFVSEGGVPDAKVLQVFESSSLPVIEEEKTDEVKTIMDVKQLKETYPELVSELEKPITELTAKVEELLKENEQFKAKQKEQEIASLKAKLIEETKESESIRGILLEKVTGSTEEELKKSIEETIAFIKKVQESNVAKAPEKKPDGNPAIEVKEIRIGSKKYTTSKEILEDAELSQEIKAEAIKKLWGWA
jgi:hypothetical protein